MVGAGQDALGGFFTAGDIMLVKEVNDALDAEFADVIRVRCVFEEHAEGETFEGFGLDNRHRNRHVGMSAAEAFDVDDGAGPDAIELAAEVNATGLEFVCGLAGEGDALVERRDFGGR